MVQSQLQLLCVENVYFSLIVTPSELKQSRDRGLLVSPKSRQQKGLIVSHPDKWVTQQWARMEWLRLVTMCPHSPQGEVWLIKNKCKLLHMYRTDVIGLFKTVMDKLHQGDMLLRLNN